MKTLSILLALGLALAGSVAAQEINPAPPVPAPSAGINRYMVIRTFPAGALAGLTAEQKQSVNRVNAKHAVSWVYSYANEDKTKTFCIYEAPSEQAVREAAADNKLPVDQIVKIPVVLQAH